ncbi:hypothetical protein OKW39_004854 [Paraburkholderia sp. MM6662-R1]
MIRWLIAFLGAWGICLAGMYVIWVVALCLNCLFAPGCFSHLTVHDVLSAVNFRGVFARGTLLAIAFTGIAWFRRRA